MRLALWSTIARRLATSLSSKKQKRLGGRIGAQESVERFDGRLFAKPPNGSTLFKAPLLVDADIGWNDPDRVKMSVDPFNNLFSSRRPMHPGCLEIDRVRDAHG